MSESRKHLIRHLGSEIALSRHMLRAIEIDLRSATTEGAVTGAFLARIRRTLEANIAEMNGLLNAMGGSLRAGAKAEVAAATGFVTGLYAGLRGENPLRLLTAHQVALNVAAMSYGVLHVTALALGEDAVAELAQRHLASTRELVFEVNRVLPELVVQELKSEGHFVDPRAAPVAAKWIASVWSGSARSPIRRAAGE